MFVTKLKCPCGSGISIAECCSAFIDAGNVPASAEQLMRARYTAYHRHHEAYILKTWHVNTRPQSLGLDSLTKWTGLKVLAAQNLSAQYSTVEFIAYFERTTLAGKIEKGQMHELSRFECDAGVWLYVDGQPVVSKIPKTGRNTPCVCGSGLKFKKCCGRA